MGPLLLLAVAFIADADTLDIRFVGNAGFVISDGTVSLVTDLPYQSGAFGYMTYDLADVRPPGRVVAIITHRHDDHFDPNSFLTTGWEIVGPREVTDHLPADRVIPLGSEVSVGQFTIIPLRTPRRKLHTQMRRRRQHQGHGGVTAGSGSYELIHQEEIRQ